MATLRVTPTFDDGWPLEEQRAALEALDASLRSAVGPGQTLTRIGGLSLPGAPAAVGGNDRVFVCTVADGDAPDALLRELGGWSMRYHEATVALKVDGPAGGVSLRLPRWSAVDFAAAAQRVRSMLIGES